MITTMACMKMKVTEKEMKTSRTIVAKKNAKRIKRMNILKTILPTIH